MPNPKKRNRNYPNSQGISNNEYLLGSQASTRVNRDLFNDFDYLNKLSPEEFAWLAEFAANQIQGVYVDPNLVGPENAAKLNDIEQIRAAYRSKNRRQNNTFDYQCIRHSIANQYSERNEEALLSVDSWLSMEDEIQDNIDIYWAEKNDLPPPPEPTTPKKSPPKRKSSHSS